MKPLLTVAIVSAVLLANTLAQTGQATTTRGEPAQTHPALGMGSAPASAPVVRDYFSQPQSLLDQIISTSALVKHDDLQLKTLAKRKADLERLLVQTQSEKQRVLNDYRQGYFCSQCRHSKSQIEAGGENFYEHLRRVNGHIVPASQQELNQKALEFDNRLSQISAEIARVVADSSATASHRQSQVDFLMRSLVEFRASVNKNENALGSDRNRAIDVGKKKLHELEVVYNTAKRSGADPFQLQLLANVVREQGRRVKETQEEFSIAAGSFAEQKQDALQKLANALPDSAPLMISPSYALPRNIPPIMLPGASAKIGPSGIEINVDFGDVVSGKLSLSDDWYKSQQNVQVGLELLGTVSGSMSRTTTWTPQGVKTEEKPIIKIGSDPE